MSSDLEAFRFKQLLPTPSRPDFLAVQRAAGADRHAERVRGKESRDKERANLVADLSAIDTIDRIQRIATDESIVLDLIPAGLIPLEPVDWEQLPAPVVDALIERIEGIGNPNALRARGAS